MQYLLHTTQNAHGEASFALQSSAYIWRLCQAPLDASYVDKILSSTMHTRVLFIIHCIRPSNPPAPVSKKSSSSSSSSSSSDVSPSLLPSLPADALLLLLWLLLPVCTDRLDPCFRESFSGYWYCSSSTAMEGEYSFEVSLLKIPLISTTLLVPESRRKDGSKKGTKHASSLTRPHARFSSGRLQQRWAVHATAR